jgi:predicted O-linked N-acetylglucosamine transferase (SPINDLY family)
VLHHWIHLRQKQCKWPVVDGLPTDLDSVLAHASPLAMLGMTDDPALQRRAAQKFVEEKVGVFERMAPASLRYGHDKIRIGYLSSDLSMHAVSLLTVELFETHDRSRFEVHAFCWSKEDGTAFRERVRNAFDHFHKIGHLDDESAARLIRDLEIDVIVDLQGLTGNARPNIVARGPAPIQIAYLGYPGTTGLPHVDYVVADRFIFPEELQPHFSEKPLYVDTGFQVSDSKRVFGPRPSRAQFGLPDDAFVFCAFNNSHKITQPMFESWLRILKATPQSVLWLLEDNPWGKENLRKAAADQGLDVDRLHFAGRIDPRDYLARFQVADLFLDTTPYNAGTTANDALWACLPILTLSGRTYVSRMAGSLLTSAGLSHFICHSLEDYEARAIKLAIDRKEAASASAALAQRKAQGWLFSTSNFCARFEGRLSDLLAAPVI